jgi:hypothetical protein
MGIDDRIGSAVSAAGLMTLVTLGGALMMYRGLATLKETGVIKPQVCVKEERKVFSYESAEVEQLAQSALRKAPLSERDKELAKMDKDKDCRITYSEVISYVRGN